MCIRDSATLDRVIAGLPAEPVSADEAFFRHCIGATGRRHVRLELGLLVVVDGKVARPLRPRPLAAWASIFPFKTIPRGGAHIHDPAHSLCAWTDVPGPSGDEA